MGNIIVAKPYFVMKAILLLMSIVCKRMSAAKKAKLGPRIYSSSTQIISYLQSELSRIPSSTSNSEGASAPRSSGKEVATTAKPMSGEITVFLVSLGKFRIVTEGHLLVWKQIVEVARDILNTPTIGRRVNVCIEISSSISQKCPPDGGMKEVLTTEEGIPNIKKTRDSKDKYSSKPIDDCVRIDDISRALHHLLGEMDLLGRPNLRATVSVTPGRRVKVDEKTPANATGSSIQVHTPFRTGPLENPRPFGKTFGFSIGDPQMADPECFELREACKVPGSERKCLVIMFGGSDRIGGSEDISAGFMPDSEVPNGLFRSGGERRDPVNMDQLLQQLLESAINGRPDIKSIIPPENVSASLVDYVTDIYLWACTPISIVSGIVSALTIPSSGKGLADIRAKQIDQRIDNATNLANYLKQGAASDDIIPFLSNHLPEDILMLQNLEFRGIKAVPSFEELASLKLRGEWWKRPEGEELAAIKEKIRLAKQVHMLLSTLSIKPECTLPASTRSRGGRRIKRKSTRRRRRTRKSAIRRRSTRRRGQRTTVKRN